MIGLSIRLSTITARVLNNVERVLYVMYMVTRGDYCRIISQVIRSKVGPHSGICIFALYGDAKEYVQPNS
jgi:hypothetical protein